MPHDDDATCTSCGVALGIAHFDAPGGPYCCGACARGDRCSCGAPVTPRGPAMPFSQTGIRHPFAGGGS